ncbi:MAG: GNAT family N-acetyltransferase [Spirochaetales bacterium]|nr:GNAT family N-acetyltransferase [Spirochaetales bacterium]
MKIAHETNRLKAEPNRKYEVTLFAVLPSMQGKGLGKELMNTFINKCIHDGVKRITLDTDEECNYQFYEHFGYHKIAEFYSPIEELYSLITDFRHMDLCSQLTP